MCTILLVTGLQIPSPDFGQTSSFSVYTPHLTHVLSNIEMLDVEAQTAKAAVTRMAESQHEALEQLIKLLTSSVHILNDTIRDSRRGQDEEQNLPSSTEIPDSIENDPCKRKDLQSSTTLTGHEELSVRIPTVSREEIARNRTSVVQKFDSKSLFSDSDCTNAYSRRFVPGFNERKWPTTRFLESSPTSGVVILCQ